MKLTFTTSLASDSSGFALALLVGYRGSIRGVSEGGVGGGGWGGGEPQPFLLCLKNFTFSTVL